jgi:hypothetical protein
MPQLQYSKVNNAIITLTDTDDSTKGKHFKSRFIQPGLAGYPGQFGNALIKKENLDRFVHTLRNKPVTINHKDKITEEDKKGEVFNVWFNPEDGWYWCDGIITDDEAINLINNGWSVSCAYDFTKADNSGGTENNIPYDIEFLDGEFNHLALVDNPRYEGANIVFNSKVENEDKWITIKPNGEDAKGRHLLIKEGESVGEALLRTYGDKKQAKLFDTNEYKISKEEFKSQKEKEQKRYQKLEDNYKKAEEKRNAEKIAKKEAEIKEDATNLTLEKFLQKHLDDFNGSYSKSMDYWEKNYKDYHTKAQPDKDKEKEKYFGLTQKEHNEFIRNITHFQNRTPAHLDKWLEQGFEVQKNDDRKLDPHEYLFYKKGVGGVGISKQTADTINKYTAEKKEDKKDNFEKETKTTKKDENRHQKVRDLEDKAYKEFKTMYDNYIDKDGMEGWGGIPASRFDKAIEQFNKKYKEEFDKLESDRFVSFEDFAKRENKQAETKEDERQERIKKLIERSDNVSMFDSGSLEKREHEKALKQIDKLDISAEEKEKTKDKLLDYHEEILTHKANAPSQYKVGVAEFNKRVGFEKSQSEYQKATDKMSERDNFVKSLKEEAAKKKKNEEFAKLSDALKSALDKGELEVKFNDNTYFRTSKRSKSFLKLDEWTKTKYNNLKSQNSLTDTILNAIAELIIGE